MVTTHHHEACPKKHPNTELQPVWFLSTCWLGGLIKSSILLTCCCCLHSHPTVQWSLCHSHAQDTAKALRAAHGTCLSQRMWNEAARSRKPPKGLVCFGKTTGNAWISRRIARGKKEWLLSLLLIYMPQQSATVERRTFSLGHWPGTSSDDLRMILQVGMSTII
jgi:hypothetical protein